MLNNKTAFALYTSTYNLATRQQIELSPKAIPDPGSPTALNLEDINYIAYGIAQAGSEVATLCAA